MMKYASGIWLMVPCLLLISLNACSDSENSQASATNAQPLEADAPDIPPADQPEPAGASIEGTAQVELGIGKTQVLSGIEIALVAEAAAEKILTVRNQQWLMKASRFKFNDGYNNLDLPMIGGTAVKESLARAKADADGRFRLTGIEPGQYRLYGQYKSRYAAGFWLVPVEVTSMDDAITLNLTDTNMHEFHNREIRRWGDQ